MLNWMIALTLLAGDGPGNTGDVRSLPSAHMMAHSANRGSITLSASGADGGRALNRTVYGFLPYWGGDTWLRYDLVSILACFCVDMDSAGDISAWNGFPEVFEGAIDGVTAAGGRAVVTVVNFSQSSIHGILTTGSANAIASIVDLVKDHPVEGVSIDFENVASADRDNLTAFMEELRYQLDMNAPGSHLSICTPAVDWSGAFDYASLAAVTDALFMMCYPFHGSWSTEAGPCCPLTGWGSTPESSSNMVWCLGDYAKYSGGRHDRVVVGLPYYGHEWETESGTSHSGVTGDCTTLIYSTLADRADLHGRIWDTESLTPWYAYYSGGWNQGWYDDQESLELKYDLVRAADLQGIGIWALGYDGSREELWDCIESSFCGEPWSDSVTDNLESRFTAHGPLQYWRNVTEDGQFYGHFYTYSISAGPDVNWASWTFQLPDSSASWMLEAYIPPGGTATVDYRVHSQGSVDTVTVDQSLHPCEWVSLGGPYFCQQGLRVTLGDCTGQTGERIVVDAVRFLPPTGIAQGPDTPPAEEGLSILSGNPAPVFLLSLPSACQGGELAVYDLSGREVWRRRLEGEGVEDHVRWPEGAGMPDGIYTAVLRSGMEVYTSRMVLLGN